MIGFGPDNGTLLLVALISATPPTIATLMAHRQIAKQAKIAEVTQQEVVKVHTLVNSQMTALKADLVIANDRIAALLSQIERGQGRHDP